MPRKELQPILKVIEATDPGDSDLWYGNPMARARKGFKGHSSYKAALGYLPLEDEGHMRMWYHGDTFPTNTYIPFTILFDSSDWIKFKIFLENDLINMVCDFDWFTFNYVKLNMVGYKRLNVRIRNLRINDTLLGQYSSKGGDRTWFFGNNNSTPFSSVYISGKLYFSEALERKYFHQIPKIDFIFGG
jgi:hypothetical protein